MLKAKMTIIGYGPMGKRFTNLFSNDFDVYVSSSRKVEDEVTSVGATIVDDRSVAIAQSDYIFLAIPIKALPELIEKINTHAQPDAVVMDCCSARVPAEEYLKRLNCNHFGLHDIKIGEFCITNTIDENMRHFFNNKNIPIIEMSPEEHDRINAVIGIGHFVGLALGKFLSSEDKDLLSKTGSGKKLVALINHLDGNTPTTWQETQMDNQFTKDMREALIQSLNKYHMVLSKGEYPF